MPYDPAQPADHSELKSQVVRAQLNALNDKIDAVPAGPPGAEGPQGPPGSNGSDGLQGPQGPAFATAVVDGVTTLNPGDPASVTTFFDGSNVRFTFAIPRGADGMNGSNGTNGNDGAQGPPGEVTNAALAAAIAGTSANTNSVATLDAPFADSDMEALRQKLNEMLLALRR